MARAPRPRLYLRGRVWWTWYRDSAGRTHRVSTGCRDQTAAAAAARAVEVRAAAGHDAAHETTLDVAGRALIASLAETGRAPATLRIYGYRLGHLVRVLGHDVLIAGLVRADLERYHAARIGEGAARSTTAAELEALRTVLRHAHEHGTYHGDVARIWPRSLVEGAHVARSGWLDLPALTRVLDVAGRTLPHRRDYLLAYVVLGVRQTELYALRARHLDAAERRVFIDGTKTRRSKRWIPVPDAAAWAMLARRAREAGAGPLFAPWSGSWVQFHRWADLASVQRFSHNDLRRTFTSLLASAGVPMLPLSRLLGHSTTAMVQAVYAQLDDASLRAVVAQLPAVTQMCTTPAQSDAPSARSGRSTVQKPVEKRRSRSGEGA